MIQKGIRLHKRIALCKQDKARQTISITVITAHLGKIIRRKHELRGGTIMEAFGDRVQTLMDEVYGEWQKEENKSKGKWEILEGFSEAHQIAVLFGNFNYQVENGGILQWIYS